MIKISDLKIGNLFLLKDKEQIVLSISWEREGRHLVNGRLHEEDLEPMPLTEEWLERMGFEKDGFNTMSKDISSFPAAFKRLVVAGDYLYLREGVINGRPHEDDLNVLWNRDLRKQFYVHELQNLFHILTGEELTINK